MLRRPIQTATLLATTFLIATALTALAKGDAIVTLDATLPGDPEPGSKLTIGWTVEIPVENGQMAPFNAEGMFIRLIPPTGDPVEAVGQQGPLSHYVATVTAPAGGIRAVEVGLRGESCTGGTCQRSDMLFTIDESAVPAIAPDATVMEPGAPKTASGPTTSLEDPAGTTAPANLSSDLGPLGLVGLGLAAAALIVGVAFLVALTPGTTRS